MIDLSLKFNKDRLDDCAEEFAARLRASLPEEEAG